MQLNLRTTLVVIGLILIHNLDAVNKSYAKDKVKSSIKPDSSLFIKKPSHHVLAQYSDEYAELARREAIIHKQWEECGKKSDDLSKKYQEGSLSEADAVKINQEIQQASDKLHQVRQDLDIEGKAQRIRKKVVEIGYSMAKSQHARTLQVYTDKDEIIFNDMKSSWAEKGK